MDNHAADCANRILENDASAPTLEILMQGAVIEVLHDTWLALCGAELEVNMPMWRAHRVRAGEVIRWARVRKGVWSYLAVEGGWEWPRAFGSTSYYARGRLGAAVRKGIVLQRRSGAGFCLSEGVSGRAACWEDIRNYEECPRIVVRKGPQWDAFTETMRSEFFETEWEVSSQSDRAGYRLGGSRILADPAEIASEPVRLGSIQVPGGGEPIVTMRDGPTVGGYPKLGVVEREYLPWLVQCRPGQKIQFELKHED